MTDLRLNVTVCELPADPERFQEAWFDLVKHAELAQSDLIVLPEMPFYSWFCAQPRPAQVVWDAACRAHEQWMLKLPELEAAVLSSRPTNQADKRINEGFIWRPDSGYEAVHEKYYLPDEAGFWEASWYERGNGNFGPVVWEGFRIGLQICTELWFMEHSRAYGQAGVDIIAVPRATERQTLNKWLTAAKTAAIISGAFLLSSNHNSVKDTPEGLGGGGWIINPEGELLGQTSRAEPFVTCTINPDEAIDAKQRYPRYVKG